MNAGTFIYVGGGRIQCSTALPGGYAPNAIPFTGGNVCVAVGVAPRSFNAGLAYGPSGRLCIDTTGAPVGGFVAGLAVTASGALACDAAAPIAGYVRGLPVTAEGRLAIGTPIAAAKGLTDLDDDENPDTLLLDTPGGGPDVTIDVDSINIDEDGDGVADTVIPR